MEWCNFLNGGLTHCDTTDAWGRIIDNVAALFAWDIVSNSIAAIVGLVLLAYLIRSVRRALGA